MARMDRRSSQLGTNAVSQKLRAKKNGVRRFPLVGRGNPKNLLDQRNKMPVVLIGCKKNNGEAEKLKKNGGNKGLRRGP